MFSSRRRAGIGGALEFDPDGRPMTPELAPYEGSPAVDGIAIGRASIWGSDPEPRR
jgi:hypothetical protein